MPAAKTPLTRRSFLRGAAAAAAVALPATAAQLVCQEPFASILCGKVALSN